MSASQTILIVDDEAGVRRSLRALLDDEFDVVLCAAGQDAVRFVSEHPGQVFAAFIDYAMPEMNGNIVCAAIRSLDQTISLIGFSAHADAPFTEPLFARFVKRNGTTMHVRELATSAVARTTTLRGL